MQRDLGLPVSVSRDGLPGEGQGFASPWLSGPGMTRRGIPSRSEFGNHRSGPCAAIAAAILLAASIA